MHTRHQTLVRLRPCPPNLCWTPPDDDYVRQDGKRDFGPLLGALVATAVSGLAWYGLWLAVQP